MGMEEEQRMGREKLTENRVKSSPRKSRAIGAKALGAFVPNVTRATFEKFGFAAATLITDWDQIAGPKIAATTLPVRLKWARATKGSETGDSRPPATLVLQVDPAHALDVEYQIPQILERINTYFGYRAVAAARLIQAPLPERRDGASRSQEPPRSVEPTESNLDAALRRMGQGVRRKNLTDA